MAGKTAILIGATGLVGGQCLQMLLDSPDYRRVIAVSRRPVPIEHRKLQRIETAFEQLDTALAKVKADDVFCCLGTTIKEAGTKAEFHKVDYGYALSFAHRMRVNGAKHFLLVSALGASPKSLVFYSKVKGLLEKDVTDLGYDHLSIFRPSLLVGERANQRFGESLGIRLTDIINPFLLGPLKNMHSVNGKEVAAAMVACAQNSELNAVNVFHYNDMQALIR